MCTLRKKENKFASHIPPFSLFSSIIKVDVSVFSKKTIRNKHLCLYYNLPEHYLQIIQKEQSKNFSSAPLFLQLSKHITDHRLWSSSSTKEPN